MASSVDVHRAAHEAFNHRDWERVRAITADDVTYADHARGLALTSADEFLDWLHGWTDGMSDAQVADTLYLDAGTHSVCRFAGRGTNDGPFGPANATGRRLDLAFCEIVRVEGDRITEGDMYYDAMSMMVQLGVLEAPAPA